MTRREENNDKNKSGGSIYVSTDGSILISGEVQNSIYSQNRISAADIGRENGMEDKMLLN